MIIVIRKNSFSPFVDVYKRLIDTLDTRNNPDRCATGKYSSYKRLSVRKEGKIELIKSIYSEISFVSLYKRAVVDKYPFVRRSLAIVFKREKKKPNRRHEKKPGDVT